jgi:hypothetical protein
MALSGLTSLAASAEGQPEIDPNEILHKPVGDHLPLRPMKVENGTLYYEEGTEVAVYGVNYQTMLSYERPGLDTLGIPLTGAALNEIARTDLEHIKRMNHTVVRAHLTPADMSGPDGELRDSPYLDNLDFVIAECGRLGIYFNMSMLNDIAGRFHFKDSFLAEGEGKGFWARKHWLTDPVKVEQTRRFITELLNRKNPYNGLRYKDDPTLALVEIMNEPSYFAFEDLDKPDVAYHKKQFEDWARENDAPADEATFLRFRHDYVKAYINSMRAMIRDMGCEKPVIWNCNWQGRIVGEEDIYQAIAESDAEVISITAYPLKQKIPGPVWRTETDTGGMNIFPELDAHYLEYEKLRWILGKRFQDKAKIFYEFEANQNKAAYVYPAMARFQRALGAQSATMWTYTLLPKAPHQHGGHYLNYLTTPQKAASTIAAAEIFRKTPRYTPFTTGVVDRVVWELTDGAAAASFELDLAVVSTPDIYVNSETVDWNPFPINGVPKQIIGYGSSEFVTYEGKGIYTLDLTDDSIRLEINPDADWLVTPWTKRSPDKPKVDLNYERTHPMTLKIPGREAIRSIHRIEDGKRTKLAVDPNISRFDVSPGIYEITR